MNKPFSIIIVSGGFAGTAVVRGLAGHTPAGVMLTLVMAILAMITALGLLAHLLSKRG